MQTVDYKVDVNKAKLFYLSIIAGIGFMLGGLVYKAGWLLIVSLVKCGS